MSTLVQVLAGIGLLYVLSQALGYVRLLLSLFVLGGRSVRMLHRTSPLRYESNRSDARCSFGSMAAGVHGPS